MSNELSNKGGICERLKKKKSKDFVSKLICQ